jgi:hypothetical protein
MARGPLRRPALYAATSRERLKETPTLLIDADPESFSPPLDLPLTDAELTALALAADPAEPLDEHAVPLHIHLAQFAGAALPQWYMPPAMARSGPRWRGPVVLAIIAAFLLIEALGLCNTFGQLTWA